MAFARLSGFFSEKGPGIDIVPADYSPNNLHAERIRHADMVLDSYVWTNYGCHTTFRDSLRAGVLNLCLTGKWFHRRIAYSLIHNIFGDRELLCGSVREYEGIGG